MALFADDFVRWNSVAGGGRIGNEEMREALANQIKCGGEMPHKAARSFLKPIHIMLFEVVRVEHLSRVLC